MLDSAAPSRSFAKSDSIGSESIGSDSVETQLCFHCQQPVPEFTSITLNIAGEDQPMCCFGCKSAAEFILQQGLADFYQDRRPELAGAQATGRSLQAKPFEPSEWDIQQTRDGLEASLHVPGLYCSSCSWLVHQALTELAKEHEFPLTVNVQAHSKRVTVQWVGGDDRLALIVERIRQLGYDALPFTDNEAEALSTIERDKAVYLKRLFVAGFGTMQVMSFAAAHYLGAAQDESIARFMELVSMVVAAVVVMYAGQHFFANAIRDIKNHHLGMDVPVAIAIAAAFFPSAAQTLLHLDGRVLYYDSAVMFVFFLLLGRFVESRARHRVIESGDAVVKSLPAQVTVSRVGANSNNAETLSINPRAAHIGDTALLRQNDIVPFDSKILSGTAYVDESLVTGEARPRKLGVGESVLASMRIDSGEITISCEKAWNESSLASLEKLVEKGKETTPAVAGLSGLLNRYFVLFVLLLTILVSTIWLFYDPSRVFEVALAMLIASCPCAFALAAPIGTTVASNRLRKLGILLANADSLLALTQAKHWWFDKTGTLTAGKPRIHSVDLYSTVDRETCLTLIAALEKHSQHPLARAFTEFDSPFTADDIEEITSNGIRAKIDGKPYFVGNLKWINKLSRADNIAEVQRHAEIDRSPVSELVLADESQILASVRIKDAPKTGVASLLGRLKQLAITTTLVSGDRQPSVTAFAEEFGFDRVFFEQSPQQKLEQLLEHKSAAPEEINVVAGDGTNDAALLSHADVAIAFASGSDLSQSQADIVVLASSCAPLEQLLRIADNTRRIMHQNMLWALGYNVAILPLAAAGFLTPWIAAIGMSLSSLGVVLNASRIR